MYIDAIVAAAEVFPSRSFTFLSLTNIANKIGCNILMSAVKLVAVVGSAAVPGAGEAIDGGISESDQTGLKIHPRINADVNFK